MGLLLLQHLPNSIKYLGLPHHAISGVNLDGLDDKTLDTLNLDHNQISMMDFAKFRGSSVRSLQLIGNHFEHLRIKDVVDSGLRHIDLSQNSIQSIEYTESDIRPLFDQSRPFQFLDLFGNPLDVPSILKWYFRFFDPFVFKCNQLVIEQESAAVESDYDERIGWRHGS